MFLSQMACLLPQAVEREESLCRRLLFLLVITRQRVCVCFCIEFIVVVYWIKACRIRSLKTFAYFGLHL